MKNDKTQKLMDCFEDIDEQFIEEAAQAVKTRPSRGFSWIGNIAAVFIGIAAISCTLVLVFWLRSMSDLPVQSDDENEIYAEETPILVTPLPSIKPVAQTLFPYGLPIPRIFETSESVVFWSNDQTHITVNNPWHDVGELYELPAFLSPMRVEERRFPNWEVVSNEHMTDEDRDAFRAKLNQIAYELGKLLGMNVFYVDTFEDTWFGHRGTMQTDNFEIIVETSFFHSEVRIIFNLLSGVATLEELIEIVQDIDFFRVMNFDFSLQSSIELVSYVDGLSIYHKYRFFEPGNNDMEAIRAFNFEWVDVLIQIAQQQSITVVITEPFLVEAESLQLGYFPIISAEEAREMLLEGYFISERREMYWSGREAALAASVELIYHTTNTDVIMPFYRFLIRDIENWEDGINSYGRYYVPAISREFLEPMTRRATPEWAPPPTGLRALPPNVFRILQIHAADFWVEDNFLRPLRIGRFMVEDLWQEVIAEIGGLAYNEAYQFRTPCGHYAMINGFRNLTSHEEMQRYHPALGLPEFDEFTLIEVFVNDGTDMMAISDTPMIPSAQYQFSPWLIADEASAPVGEIFTRPLSVNDHTFAFAFYALYEHRSGVQIGFGVSSLFFDARSGLPDDHIAVDMGEYGVVYFIGSNGFYHKAVYEPPGYLGFAVELWFHNGPIENRFSYLDLRYRHGWFEDMFTAVPQEDLEELVRAFNPAALAQEFGWQLMSWQ